MCPPIASSPWVGAHLLVSSSPHLGHLYFFKRGNILAPHLPQRGISLVLTTLLGPHLLGVYPPQLHAIIHLPLKRLAKLQTERIPLM